MTDIVKQSTFDRRIPSITMTVFALASIVIASAGPYGIVNYMVSRRTHEIGIRLALGARRSQVLIMIMTGGIRLIISGAVSGAIGATMASQALQSMLFGITSYDPPTYLATGIVLVAAVAAATLLPAKRAAGMDPTRALRSE